MAIEALGKLSRQRFCEEEKERLSVLFFLVRTACRGFDASRGVGDRDCRAVRAEQGEPNGQWK